MPFKPGHTPSNKGKASAVNPIVDPAQIQAIKDLLSNRPRDLALFVLGLNTALRCGDLLNLERSDLELLPDGRFKLHLLERKTGKAKHVELNLQTSQVLARHLHTSTGRYLFEGTRGQLTVRYVGRLIKEWTAQVGITTRVATHTLRKTFVRRHLDTGAKLVTLMHCLNHSSERQTLAYCGIMAEDTHKLYMTAI